MSIKNFKNKLQDKKPIRLELIRNANCMKRQNRTDRMEDYLEVIYELVREKGYAVSADISEYLQVSPPSVTKMLKRLSQDGYINYEKYRGISLSREGAVVAEGVSKRHGMFSDFLEMIGVDKDIANRDAEGIEHHLNQNTARKLEEFIRIMKKNHKAFTVKNQHTP